MVFISHKYDPIWSGALIPTIASINLGVIDYWQDNEETKEHSKNY